MSVIDLQTRSSFVAPGYKVMNRKKALVNEFNRNRGEILESRENFVSLTKCFSDVLAGHVAKAHDRIKEHNLSVEVQSRFEAEAAADAAVKSGELNPQEAQVFEDIVEMAIIHESEHGWPSVAKGPALSQLVH